MKKFTLLYLFLLLPLLIACGSVPAADQGATSGTTQEATPVMAEPAATATVEEEMPTQAPTESPTEEATMEPTEQASTATPAPTSKPPVEPTPVPGETPATTQGSEVSDDVIFVYERQGGFAGFCDTLTVTREVAIWTSCMRSGGKVELDAAMQQRLMDLSNQYAAFQDRSEDNPGGSDSMTQIIQFYGTGSQEASQDLQSTLQQIASELLGQAYQTQ